MKQHSEIDLLVFKGKQIIVQGEKTFFIVILFIILIALKQTCFKHVKVVFLLKITQGQFCLIFFMLFHNFYIGSPT